MRGSGRWARYARGTTERGTAARVFRGHASRTTSFDAWTRCTANGGSIWVMRGCCGFGGNARCGPNQCNARSGEYRLWHEAMERLAPILRRKGIVT
ncbi:MAG: hypothetical protein WDN04_16880 [Rhodospirillales bacterium]